MEAPTRGNIKLLKASVDILTNQPSPDDLAFTHTVLCQVGLPRSQVIAREFFRSSGAAWIQIQAGTLDEGSGPVLQPLPYGPLPRLALAWVSTYAMRNKDRSIPIGHSAGEFLKKMSMGDDGRRYATLRRQMHALAACHLTIGGGGRTYQGQAVESFDAWVADKAPHQRARWPGVLVLSDSYYRSLLEGAVPLDNRALMALSGSALALDIYTWLAHRLHRVERITILRWRSLRDQFGQEYQGLEPDKDFKKKFLPAMKKVLAVYPGARVEPVKFGLKLAPSPPPIPYKG